MATLIDTSILGRLANRSDSSHAIAASAVAELHRRGEVLHVAAQNLIEFRGFATRPVGANGLGLSSATAERLASAFESAFPLLGETPDIYPEWKKVVSSFGIVGKQVHDARLVAICHVHAVTHVMTFNVAHFARMASPPTLVVIDPAKV